MSLANHQENSQIPPLACELFSIHVSGPAASTSEVDWAPYPGMGIGMGMGKEREQQLYGVYQLQQLT